MCLNFNLNHYNTAATETATNIQYTSSKDLHAKFRSRELMPARDLPAKLRCCENNRDQKNAKRAIKYAR